MTNRPQAVEAAIHQLSKFTKEWRLMRSTGDEIYGLHSGIEEKECSLSASDIDCVIAHIRQLEQAAPVWLPIETAPKYPLDACMDGPRFLALCSDGYIHECWWSFPQQGSIAYAKNHPPVIMRVVEQRGVGCVNEKPTHWYPKPTPPSADTAATGGM